MAKACEDAVAERGAFALAIPGGSILKVPRGHLVGEGSTDDRWMWLVGLLSSFLVPTCPNT